MTGGAAAIVLVLAITAAGSAVLTSVVRRWAERRLMDVPNERSSHERPVPRGGGLAMVLAVTITATLLSVLSGTFREVAPVLAAGAALAAIGFMDDARHLPALVRLGAQVIAAVGVLALQPAHQLLNTMLPISQPVAAVLLVLWIVGLVNAYNFMDGIDGIAGVQAVIAGIAWFVIGIITANIAVLLLGGGLAAGAVGFLRHNWPPARIFMGDVGSTYLGYMFAVIPLLAMRSVPHALVPGLLFVGLFVFDTSFTFVRRLVNGERVMQAHRSHLYQRLASALGSHRPVTLLYGSLAAVLAATGIITASNGTLAIAVGGGAFVSACLLLYIIVRKHEHHAGRGFGQT